MHSASCRPSARVAHATVAQRHAPAARTSSWCAMTPADQMSDSGPTLELSTSGAMNLQGAPPLLMHTHTDPA
jgi:hypothetical protein